MQKEFDDAILFCLEKEKDKPNTKLVKVWENACNTLIQRKNEEMAIKILECIGNRIPNFSYKNVYSCAMKNECQMVVRECLNKMNKGGDALKKVLGLSKQKFVSKKKIAVSFPTIWAAFSYARYKDKSLWNTMIYYCTKQKKKESGILNN